MALGILGKKLGMTQIFDENGNIIPITVVSAGPCQILEVKSRDKDGYSALKLGYEEKIKNVNKPDKGYFEAVGKVAGKTITPKKVVKEFRLDDTSKYKAGDVIGLDIFQAGEKVNVVAINKGKGFQGVVKRYHMHGGPETHGSKFHRKPGAIGAHTFPSKVWKGQKMPGHMGNVQVTVKNLTIVKVDQEKNLLLIKGALPGFTRALVLINKKSN